jgi:UDP-sulfoquinovose synthase
MQRVLVFGGDGFCGWPISLRLSNAGYDVTIVDNLSRRAIDDELECESLTPIRTMKKRTERWKQLTGNRIYFKRVDIATNYHGVWDILKKLKPDAIVHLAEQRAAPYSMKDATKKIYTVNNNISATHNLLVAISDLKIDCHVVHIGSMGVYGYGGDSEFILPEGYVACDLKDSCGAELPVEILFPYDPGSVYHMTKTMDAQMFYFYNKNDKIRISDLHQGVVWGTQTDETEMHADLVNRFDYDGDYGTVLNRFLVEGIVGHPITVYGSGERERAFIHIRDTAKCVQLAIENPPTTNRVRIVNQTAEQLNLRGLAELAANLTGGKIRYYRNPRVEKDAAKLKVSNQNLLDMGIEPAKLNDAALEQVCSLVRKHKDRVDMTKIITTSVWRKGMVADGKGKKRPHTGKSAQGS